MTESVGGAGAPVPPTRPTLEIGGLLSWAWGLFRANLGYLVGGAAITMALGLVIGVAGYATWIVRVGFLEAFRNPETAPEPTFGDLLSGYALMLAVILVGSLLICWIGVNYVRGAMLLVDGGRPTIGSLFRPVRVLPAMGLTLLLSLGAVVGYALCFVGVLFWSFGTLFTIEAFVDGRSPVRATRTSIQLVRANLASAALLWLVGNALLLGGYLVCGIGLLVAAPVTLLMTIGGYRWLQGLGEGPTTVARG